MDFAAGPDCSFKDLVRQVGNREASRVLCEGKRKLESGSLGCPICVTKHKNTQDARNKLRFAEGRPTRAGDIPVSRFGVKFSKGEKMVWCFREAGVGKEENAQ